MAKQKHKPFLRPILVDALKLTWENKAMWFIGLLAFFITGSLGYQLILQGVQSVLQPLQWWERWQNFAQGASAIDIVAGQFQLLFSDPIGWLIASVVWGLILLVLFALYCISAYAITTVIAYAKLQLDEKKTSSLGHAIQEAKHYFWTVFWIILLFQLAANVLILLFSIPVIWFGVTQSGTIATIFLFLFLAIFLVAVFMISMIALYALQYAVVQEEKLGAAIALAWRLFLKHWVITLEMFLIHVLISIAVSLLVIIASSLIVIPVAIIGLILVSNQAFVLSSFLPQLLLILLSILLVVSNVLLNMFQLYSWTFLVTRFEEVHPKSRFATWIEIKLLTGA